MRIILFIFLTLPAFSLTLMAKPAEFTLAYQDTTEYRTTSGEEGECLITFSLTGDQIAGALDAGRWEIKEALDDQGTRLNPPESYTRNFTPLMRRSSAQDSEAVLKLGLSVPPRTANHIRSLKGSLGINVYRQQIVIIEDLEKNRNQLIENPLFQVHGFTVQLIDPQHAYPGYTSESEKRVLYSRAVAVRIEGNINKVNSFRLVDPGGNELASRPAGFAAGRSRIMGRMADQPLPAKTTLHLQIPIDPKEVRIPFSFTDIPLP